jgi:hypothetical protein
MLITIATYNQIYLADLAKARLLDYDVPCVIQDQNMVGMNLFYSNAVGGIKLQVPERFAEIALSILNGPGTSGSTDEEIEEIDKVYCPDCKSIDVLPKRYNPVLLMLSSILLVVPFGDILFSTSRSAYKCTACGNIWNMGDEDVHNDPE